MNIRARQTAPKDNDGDDSYLYSIALLSSGVHGSHTGDEDSASVLKLIYIAELYKIKLEQLGVTVEKIIHTTRLSNLYLRAH